MNFTAITLALLSGILPALLWLWFWLREDNLHPEPRSRVAKTFFAGMLSVVIVLPIQIYISSVTGKGTSEQYLLWAFTEESLKFAVAFLVALSTDIMDEPIDAVIYMITASLGFAAVENTLFILNPLLQGDFVRSIVTTNLRFIGATLLHVVSSASIGLCVALAFYESSKIKHAAVITGLILATALHTAFNLFIIRASAFGTLKVFFFVWLAVVILMLLFEKVKTIKPHYV
jgi:RsiW-degrading membrane proteinase PrsW (M82 family)